MTYSSAEEFDRAAKRAIKESGRNPGNAYREMLRDRFLCRIFWGGCKKFVLKGGTGMLARIPDARATRDLDFATLERDSVDETIASLDSLVSQDLGDFCSFRLTKREESLDENGYSRLLKLRYASYVGLQEKDPILIDLSLDCSTTLPPEYITPANRITLKGITVSDYLTYPAPDQLADKFCAIMERQPSGLPSSRMKDLVDVTIWITHTEFDYDQVRHAVRAERAKRSMAIPEEFAAPATWRKRYSTFAKRNGAPSDYDEFDAASNLASMFFNPVLFPDGKGPQRWNPEGLVWSGGTALGKC